jgi:hypothetical protein
LISAGGESKGSLIPCFMQRVCKSSGIVAVPAIIDIFWFAWLVGSDMVAVPAVIDSF